MATPILNQLSVDLSYITQDPVVSATTNGKRISSSGRLVYLKRAYSRLKLLLSNYPSKIYEQCFSSGISQKIVITNAQGETPYTEEKIFSIQASKDGVTYYSCALIPVEEFHKRENNINPFLSPNYNNNVFFYSIYNKLIHILPRPNTYVLNMIIHPEITESLTYNGATDIDLDEVYHDLFLKFAAAEMYLDIADTTRAQSLIQIATNEIVNIINKLQALKNENNS